MANSISEKVTAYTQALDRIVTQGTLTNDLNINGAFLGEMNSAGQIKVAKIAMDGLADHTRGGGFTKGDVTLTWETVKLNFDRDREFDIDVLDNEETLSIVTAEAMGEFARLKVVPEVDAIRFAKLAAAATGQGVASPTTYSTAADAFDAVLAAEEYIQDNGTALQDCVLYCAPYMKTLLRKASKDSFNLRPGEGPNTNFQTFDEMKIVTVPTNRFYTAINLYDGSTSGEEAGGYVKGAAQYTLTSDSKAVANKDYYSKSGSTYTKETVTVGTTDVSTFYELTTAAGCDINFMIVNPECGNAIVRHNPLRYFAPDVNQTDDAHKWQYRIFHDLFVLDNKVDGIYLSAKAS